ncbi:MAG: ImmA/IrrE family metallo-endopeptidase [bacterium]|nr:ImmA/IrrE family metallo-endopeptidase [bacterium]
MSSADLFPDAVDPDELAKRVIPLPGDALPGIDEAASPFLIALCQRYHVGVELGFYHTTNFKIGRSIYLDRNLSPERQNFSFCHELAHLLLEHDNETHPSQEEEFLANQLAARLLLPDATFGLDAKSLPLAALKEKYPYASWEAILRRKLQFRHGVGTIVDEGKITFRGASPSIAFPHHPSPNEWGIIRDAFNEACSLFREQDGLTMTADYVDTGSGVRRVLLWTEWEEL